MFVKAEQQSGASTWVAMFVQYVTERLLRGRHTIAFAPAAAGVLVINFRRHKYTDIESPITTACRCIVDSLLEFDPGQQQYGSPSALVQADAARKIDQRGRLSTEAHTGHEETMLLAARNALLQLDRVAVALDKSILIVADNTCQALVIPAIADTICGTFVDGFQKLSVLVVGDDRVHASILQAGYQPPAGWKLNDLHPVTQPMSPAEQKEFILTDPHVAGVLKTFWAKNPNVRDRLLRPVSSNVVKFVQFVTNEAEVRRKTQGITESIQAAQRSRQATIEAFASGGGGGGGRHAF